jgi:ceramide glucosyltransferase
MRLLTILAALAAGFGLVQHLAGALAVGQFVRRGQPGSRATIACPPFSVLKPLHGNEVLLEQALATFCRQDYPVFQVVFGVQDAADSALPVVCRLQARFPECDIAVVVDPTPHGANRKIGNLINMLPHARHDLLMIADGDIHAPADLLRRVAAEFERPGIGLVTTLYSGLPGQPAIPCRLGATQITHAFLPGVLLGRALGRQDCLGATMSLRRETLAAAGGLAALADQLADDALLGILVRAQGLEIGLADAVPATTVVETDFGSLFRHELRWARTMRSVAPIGHALSVLQYPLFWAAVAATLSGLAGWSLALFGATWIGRAAMARRIDRDLGLATRAPIWLLPLRELMSIIVILANYGSDRVQWRGQVLRVSRLEVLRR